MKATVPSPRETSVLRYIAWGYTNKEVAGLLKLSVKTIETHKANAMRKLKLRNRFAVVQYGVGQGWLDRNATPAVVENENFIGQAGI